LKTVTLDTLSFILGSVLSTISEQSNISHRYQAGRLAQDLGEESPSHWLVYRIGG
jgi:hypothetical protein